MNQRILEWKLVEHRPSASASAVALLVSVLLPLSACTLPTGSDDRFDGGTVTIPIPLSVTVEDSLHLACPAEAEADSAYHWISPQSSVRLDPDQSTELAILAEDLPPSRAGAPRCGPAGHQAGVRRPGTYRARSDGSIIFTWARVSEPDTAGVWVTSEEASISNGLPISDRQLSAVLDFRGTEARVVLGFPLEQGP